MRPQHITAENAPITSGGARTTRRFNEAAAYHCGKPERDRDASAGATSGFNEAAAYHCGKRPSAAAPPGGGARFNEAAAYHCGKRQP